MKTTFINEISFRYFLQLATWYSCVSACYILTNVSCGIISLQLELWPTNLSSTSISSETNYREHIPRSFITPLRNLSTKPTCINFHWNVRLYVKSTFLKLCRAQCGNETVSIIVYLSYRLIKISVTKWYWRSITKIERTRKIHSIKDVAKFGINFNLKKNSFGRYFIFVSYFKC